jgi:hypothetical protein
MVIGQQYPVSLFLLSWDFDAGMGQEFFLFFFSLLNSFMYYNEALKTHTKGTCL